MMHGRGKSDEATGSPDRASFTPGPANALPLLTQGGSRMRASRTYGSGAARLAAVPAGESPASKRSPVPCCSHTQRWEGRPTCRKPGSKSPLGLGDRSDPTRGASNLTGRSVTSTRKPRNTCPVRIGLRELWECRAAQNSVKANVGHRRPGPMMMPELPGVIEGGMLGRNGQRKPGTTRGSPRRSRTAKASRISCYAAKSRCACEWGGWGRLSDDGPGQNNPDPSEDPLGRRTTHPPRRYIDARPTRHSAGSPRT
jgi:hypothetical protein